MRWFLFKNINNKFIINSNGIVIIELVFVVIIIVLFIKLLLFVVVYNLIVGKLDCILYFIVGIVWEWVKLYSNDNVLI